MAKIVLLYPPLVIEGMYKQVATGSEVYPEGLCILAAIARDQGHIPVIIDAKAKNYDENTTVEKIIAEEPDFVGITAPTMLINIAGSIGRKLKEINDKIITIIGGPHISALPHETMEKFNSLDYGVIGEGEETLPELMHTIIESGMLDDVKGIVFRKDNTIFQTAPRPRIRNLDTIPFPAWDLLPGIIADYQQSIVRINRLPSISIVTSRGCPSKCSFCARNVFGNICTSYSADRVIQTIKKLKGLYGIRSLAIEDENFVVFKKRLIEVCHRLIDEKINVTWSCAARVDQVDLETLKLMKRAGCWSISYGIESGSEDILKLANKGITKDKIINALRITRKAHIESKGYFIIGLPGETLETINETRKFVLSLPLDYFQMSFLNAFPGTDIYNNFMKYGTFVNDWDKMNIWTPNFLPNGLTFEALAIEQKKIFRSFYFRPKIVLNFGIQILRSGNLLKYVKEGLKILRFLLIRKN